MPPEHLHHPADDTTAVVKASVYEAVYRSLAMTIEILDIMTEETPGDDPILVQLKAAARIVSRHALAGLPDARPFVAGADLPNPRSE